MYIKFKIRYKDIIKRKQQNLYYSESELLYMFTQLLNGLDYIHSKDIIHRDIKSLNIFIFGKTENGYILKIGDFGVSRLVYSLLLIV